MLRIIIVSMVLTLLTACGGQQRQVSGISEDTMLVVRGEQLVGLTVSIGDNFERAISSADLTSFELGVLGAKDRENEGLQTVTFKVDEGEQKISVTSGSKVIVGRSMYFSKGQVRELRVRR